MKHLTCTLHAQASKIQLKVANYYFFSLLTGLVSLALYSNLKHEKNSDNDKEGGGLSCLLSDCLSTWTPANNSYL